MPFASQAASEFKLPPDGNIGDLLSGVQIGLTRLGYTNVGQFVAIRSADGGDLYFSVSGFRADGQNGDMFTLVSYWDLQSRDLGGNEQETFGQAIYCVSAGAGVQAVTEFEILGVQNMISNINSL